jgi:hypothetical protein
VRGLLDATWEEWFDDMKISLGLSTEGEQVTVLEGILLDQSALYGILYKIRNLGLDLVSLSSKKYKGINDGEKV